MERPGLRVAVDGAVRRESRFTRRGEFANLRFMMRNVARLMVLCGLLLVAAGCHTITNLTPASLPRNPSGLYPVEVKFDHREQALRQESIRPLVMINDQFYPMERTRLMKNRWETLIPVPADQKEVYYRFKFEYWVNAFPEPRQDSKLSPTYKLTIKD